MFSSNSSSRSALKGGHWRPYLQFYQYDDQGNAEEPIIYYSNVLMNKLVPVVQQCGKISAITLYTIDLESFKRVADIISHHFVIVETKDGYVFSFEKGQEGIMMQSCHSSTSGKKLT